jgi:hypothetical protein
LITVEKKKNKHPKNKQGVYPSPELRLTPLPTLAIFAHFLPISYTFSPKTIKPLSPKRQGLKRIYFEFY